MSKRVVWREGLFIRPQHFQQQDRYVQTSMMIMNKELHSNGWGFFDLQLDTSLLASGKLVLKSASGVLPDGELFSISSETKALTLDVKEGDSGKSVYLALPITMPHSDELYFDGEKVLQTRYVAHTTSSVPNINAGEESETDLLCAYQNFALMFEDEMKKGYVGIKVTEIGAISSSGIVTIDDNYLPTYLHLHAAIPLVDKLKELMNMLEYRAQKLVEKLSDSSVQAAELGEHLMLQLLNKTESRLTFFMTQDRIHPSKLFLELVSFAGELAIFMKKGKRLEHQPVYLHQEQGASFEALFRELKEMLSMVLEQNSLSLAIEKRKYGIYVSQLNDKNLVDSSTFILAVSADLEGAKLTKLLMANLKVGSIETIRNLVNYHLAGFALKPLSVAPRQIPYRMNNIYFKLELSREDKEKLKNSGGFAFHLSKEIPNIDYGLWVIRND